MALFGIAGAQTFTVAAETIAEFKGVARRSRDDIWVRIRSAVKPDIGSRVGLTIDVTELGRPLEAVGIVRAADPEGFRAQIVHAALADLIVLRHCLEDTKATAGALGSTKPGLGDGKPRTATSPGGLDAWVLGDVALAPASAPPKPTRSDFIPVTTDAEEMRSLIISDKATIVSPRVVGIDLGTSNSCIVLCEPGGRVEFFADEQGRETMPSIVSYLPEGTVKIGYDAAAQLVDHPERTIYGSKRFIGRPFSSEAVQRMMHKFPYTLVPDESHYVAALVDSRTKSPVDVATRILRELKTRAERQVGNELVRSVITVPAYYNDNQRHAVKRAGLLAGLQVERIIDEPTAAAIAFGITTPLADANVLVYDLGGGTFDVSVLHIKGSDFKVLATSGDNFLGGEDFDGRIVDYVIKTYEEGYGHNIWSTHPGIRARFKKQAEEAKHRLTNESVARIEVDNVPLTSRGTTNVLVNLTRSKLEELVSSLVDRSIFYCDHALIEARLKREDLHAVLLCGGQTLMPYVRQRLKAHFGDIVRYDVDPAKAVAMGAALLGQSVEQGLPAVSLQAVLPMTIGLASPQTPVFRPIIFRNTPLPVREAFPVTISREEWSSWRHDVFQGDSKTLEENEYLGTLEVYTLEPGHTDQIQLMVEFVLTKECLLKVYVTNQSTGIREEVLLSNKATPPSVAALREKRP